MSDLSNRIDPHGLHSAEVDHQRTVPDAEPGETVTAAADGNRQPRVPGKPDRRDDVGRAGTADDTDRPLVHGCVPYPARRVVAALFREKKHASQPRSEVSNSLEAERVQCSLDDVSLLG